MKPRLPAPDELTPDTAIDGKDRRKLLNDAVITLALHWMQHPAAARGKSHYIPCSHPSGLGGWSGRTIHIPADFPLPNAAA